MTLRWSPSSDDIAVADYIVYRDGKEEGRTQATTYRTTLRYWDLSQPGETFSVRAADAAGHLSDPATTAPLYCTPG